MVARGGVVRRASWFIGLSVLLNMLVTIFSDEKLAFLYKDQLHFDASATATFSLVVSAPGYLRAFMGAGVDLFPLLGSHRRTYYAASWSCMAVALLALALIRDYGQLAVGVALFAFAAGANLMFVVMDAVLARIGNDTGATGRLQSIQQGVRVLVGVSFAGPLSGYVTQNWSYEACFGAAALTALLGLLVTVLIDEPQPFAARARGAADGADARRALRGALRSVGLWVLVAYIFYLILTPGTSTARFYYDVDVLHLSKQTIGNLGFATAAGASLGIVAFGIISRRLPTYWLVFLSFGMDALGYLLNFGLLDTKTAFAVAFLNGIVGYLYTLSMITLFARACPPGAEATIYGLFVGAQTLAGTLSERIGSAVYDGFGAGSRLAGWHALLWCGFTMTLLAVAFIPFLPKWTRSGERISAAAA